MLPERLRLALEPSNTARAVRNKERCLDLLQAEGGPLARWQRAADLWCGLQLDPPPGLTPATYAELLRHAAGLDTSAREHHLSSLVDRASAASRFVAKPGTLTIDASAKSPTGLGLADVLTISQPTEIFDKIDVKAEAQ